MATRNQKFLSKVISNGVRLTSYLLIAAILFTSACSSRSPKTVRKSRLDSAKGISGKRIVVEKKVLPAAPWQFWGRENFGSSELALGDKFADQGRFEQAASAYRVAIQKARSENVAETALLRLCGTLLKIGQSKTVLEEVSKFVKVRGVSAQALAPEFSLIVAYAYLHQREDDQVLAWLSLVNSKTRGQGIYADHASLEAKRLVQSLSAAVFDSVAQRWAMDPFVSPLFALERQRRAEGGKSERGFDFQWFTGAYYLKLAEKKDERVKEFDLSNEASPSVEGNQELAPEAELMPAKAETPGGLSLGLLLPFSGQYAPHAQQVKEGVELAMELDFSSLPVRLVTGDTRGEDVFADKEYEKLVRTEGAKAVLGPLLAKTSKQAASRTSELGVPLVSFTKQEGLSQFGPTVFRLGVTVESQLESLLGYACGMERLRNFAIVYPENSSGREFANSFRRLMSQFGAKLVAETSYSSGEHSSMVKAVAVLSKVTELDAILLPDSLERIAPILKGLKDSGLSSVKLLGAAQWDDPVALRSFSEYLEGAVFVSPFYAKSERPVVTRFVDAYRAKFSKEPELLAAQAFDAATLALNAMKDGQTTGGAMVRKLQQLPSFEGVTGRIEGSMGCDFNRRMAIIRWQNGQAVEVR